MVGSLSPYARPTYRYKTASRGSEKAISWGLPMFSQAISGTPLRMEEQGDLCSGRNGAEGSAGLPPRTPGARHRAQVFEPRGGRGLLIAGCKCPAGSNDGVGTPPETEGTWPLESSLERSPPRPLVHKSILRTVSVRGWECFWAVFPSGNRVVL